MAAETEAGWTSILSQPFVWVFGFLTITWVVSALATAWRKVKEAEMTAHLKNEMIQRGMSADEIRTVIEARPGRVCSQDGAKRGTDVHFH